MSFRFTPNRNFTRDLRRSAEWHRFAMDKAQDAARIATTHTPDGFMMRGEKPKAEATPEGAALVLDGPGWWLIEGGTATTPPHAPLRKGIEGAGMKYAPR